MRIEHSIASRILIIIWLAVILGLASVCWGGEQELAGIKLGSNPQTVMDIYSTPSATMASTPMGTLDLVTMEGPPVSALTATGMPAMGGVPGGAAGAPGTPGMAGQPGLSTGIVFPQWAYPVRVIQLNKEQVEWMYNRKPLSIGVVISGEGPDAAVTDIVVSCMRPNDAVQTEKEIKLGDTFAQVLQAYGYPKKVEVYLESPSSTQTIGTGVGTSGPGTLPGIGPAMVPGAPPMGAPGGMMPGPGVSGAPGTTAVPGIEPGKGLVISFDTEPRVFTKSCIITYDSIDFTFHDLKVVRIHIWE